ncbi:hypothetical protein COHA_005898 [Chlorella ohadii]|uniref:Fe-S metabolism associated domain-containing protein n=1 Tax=Chlorella ohadii TaxID=2649997 RepID=A0AAD5H5S4_9CHLO|nr:hypothetical protein COHA_005898 [Chlorella ohadii]
MQQISVGGSSHAACVEAVAAAPLAGQLAGWASLAAIATHSSTDRDVVPRSSQRRLPRSGAPATAEGASGAQRGRGASQATSEHLGLQIELLPRRCPFTAGSLWPTSPQAVRCSAAASGTLPQSLQTLISAFQAVPDPMARYKQLLFYATKLEPFPVEQHTEENKVKGCVSQVWVLADHRDGKLYWKADSDSQLTKGLAALLVQGLSGCTAEEIMRVPPDFIAMLGLQQALTPSRNNGFLNMFKLMQKKALDIYMQQAGGSDDETPTSSASSATAAAAAGAADGAAAADGSGSEGDGSGGGASNTPVADSIRRKLREELQPLRLEVVDNSHQHAGHAGYRGSAGYSGETHFNVEVVSSRFEGLTSIKRHRLVYQILEAEMRSPVHALSLITKTPAEAGMA